jgi:Brix domain
MPQYSLCLCKKPGTSDADDDQLIFATLERVSDEFQSPRSLRRRCLRCPASACVVWKHLSIFIFACTECTVRIHQHSTDYLDACYRTTSTTCTALQNATTAMFFEARKKRDLYIWLSKVPSGPSVRFYCTNIHTMAELKLSGNHLKGSRPVVTFDAAFDEQPHLQVRPHTKYCLLGTLHIPCCVVVPLNCRSHLLQIRAAAENSDSVAPTTGERQRWYTLVHSRC